MPVKRLNYFHYQFLQEQDFKDEQGYHLSMRRRHNRDFHTFGRVRGLDVSFVPGQRSVTISPGMAVNSLGQEIVVESNYEVDLQTFPGQSVYLVIAYREENTDPPTQAGVAGNFTRTTESFEPPRVYPAAGPPSWDTGRELILARITLNPGPPTGDGAVVSTDFADRVEAGAKIGQADLPALRFTVAGHGGSDWPGMRGTSLTAPGTGVQGIDVTAGTAAFSRDVNVARNLTVDGDLTVRGVVNRTDELVIRDSIVRVNRYEPPTTTPAPVNGGLEVYRGGTAANAQIIWDESVDRWRIGVEAGLDFVARAADVDQHFHATTGHQHTGLAGQGPRLSHGNLDNVLAAVLTSTDATANKHVSDAQTKAWQDHVNLTSSNPHGTTAAQVGALPAADYGFASSAAASVVFTQLNASGATVTITTNFRTKFIWLVGFVNASLAGLGSGTPITGYADVRGTLIQRCTSAQITRLSVAPFWTLTSGTATELCRAMFQDLTVSPNRIESLGVAVSAVTSTGLTLVLSRNVPSTTTVTYSPLTSFTISLTLLCLG